MAIRILFLSHLFPTSAHSAVGRFVEDQVYAAANEDVEPLVVTVRFLQLQLSNPFPFFQGAYDGLLRGRARLGVSARGTRYHELQCPAPRLGGAVQAVIYAMCVVRYLPRLQANGQKFDLVHAHTSLLDGTAGRAAARRLQIPLAITEHTGPFDSLFRHIGSKTLVRLALNSASRIFTVSTALRSDILQFFPRVSSKIQVVTNTFSTETFFFEDSNLPVETVGWLGYISPIKRIDRVLATFAEMKKSLPALKLKIISVDRLPEEFIRLAKRDGILNFVETIATADRAEVARALRGLSVLLVTSDSETFSVACLEALAVGTPVVSTDCGGPRDIILTDQDGLIVDSNEPRDLAAASIRMMASDTLEARRARAVRAGEKFGESAVGKSYSDAYRDLIATKVLEPRP